MLRRCKKIWLLTYLCGSYSHLEIIKSRINGAEVADRLQALRQCSAIQMEQLSYHCRAKDRIRLWCRCVVILLRGRWCLSGVCFLTRIQACSICVKSASQLNGCRPNSAQVVAQQVEEYEYLRIELGLPSTVNEVQLLFQSAG